MSDVTAAENPSVTSQMGVASSETAVCTEARYFTTQRKTLLSKKTVTVNSQFQE